MGGPAAGVVVLVRFPFRTSPPRSSARHSSWPRLVAPTGFFVRSPVSRTGDRGAVALVPGSFAEGGLPRESFVRPGKLFTANESIFVRQVGRLTSAVHAAVVEGVVTLLRAGLN